MNKHTSGPWKANDIYIETIHERRPGHPDTVAVITGHPTKQQYDARLIAAAPEMLEALLRIEAMCSNLLRGGGRAAENLHSLRDALAEACDIASDAVLLAIHGVQP
ncbi:MAG: hypothetical protein Q4A98_05970 [Comamonadaceae bacterium]|nr:hypothetical protein [Comamonadaceae bacterium]